MAQGPHFSVLRTQAELNLWLNEQRKRDRSVGLVPTMGFLHDGHLSLVKIAMQASDVVLMSIFVNPTQFGPSEDLDRYPRDESGDLEKAKAAGCRAVFLPDVADIYPVGWETRIEPGPLASRLCGGRRPGHFSGVCTVVLKLLNMTRCQVAVFGQKDYQQLAVIRRMVTDLNLPVQILAGSIVRETDGLARSSRNAYLTAEQRRQAPELYRALRATEAAWRAGARDPVILMKDITERLERLSQARIDYVEMVDARSLQPWVPGEGGLVLLALAVYFGETRLIDNLELNPA